MPEDVAWEARSIAFHDPTRNDLKSDNYKISIDCPLPDMFANEYRQILLQEQVPDTDQYDEANYTVWRSEAHHIRQYLERTFGKVNRARVAVTPPGGELAWHIDTDTSVMCRVQIGVNVNDCEFQFNRKGDEESFRMEPNELWFINTGWEHRVVNHSPTAARVVVIAGVLHEDLKHLL